MLPVSSLAAMPMPTPNHQAAVNGDGLAMNLLDSVYQTEDPQERIELILAAAQAAPDNVEVLVTSSEMLFYLDELDEYAERCEEMLRHALTLSKGEGELESYVLQALCDQLIYHKRYDEAKAMLEDALSRMPSDDSLRMTYAIVLYVADDMAESLALLKALSEENPYNLDALRIYGEVLLEDYQYEAALDVFEQIETTWPEYLDGTVGKFMTYIAMGEFELGIRTMNPLLQNATDDGLWLERARIRLWNQQMPEETLKETEALLRKDPEWIDAMIVRLSAQLFLDQMDGARATAADIQAVDEDIGDLMLSIVEMNDGQWDASRRTLQQLIARVPDYASAYKNLSSVRLSGYGDVEGAADAIREAFAITGEYGAFDMYLQLAEVRRREGDLLETARAYHAANQLVTDDPSALYSLVLVTVDAGLTDTAEEMLVEMERRYPGWYETMLARMYIEDAQMRPEAARKVFEGLEEKFPFPVETIPYLNDFGNLLLAAIGDEAGASALKENLAAMGDAPEEATASAYAFALCLLDDLDAAWAAQEAAEALLDEADEATKLTADYRSDLLFSLGVRAELYIAADDYEKAVDTYETLIGMQWPPYSLYEHPAYEALREVDGFDAMMAAYPPYTEWDYMATPAIPQ